MPLGDIEPYVKDFMDAAIWNGKSMREWLYMGLPAMMDAGADFYKREYEQQRDLLAKRSGDPEMRSLALENGSADRAMPDIELRYGALCESSDSCSIVEKMQARMRGFHQCRQDRQWLLGEFLPLLKELEKGAPPARHHVTFLEDAGKTANIDFYTDRPLLFAALQWQPDGDVEDRIVKFLAGLKARIIVHLYKVSQYPGSGAGRHA